MKNIFSDSRACWGLLLAYVLVAPFLSLTGIPMAWDALSLMDWQRLLEAVVLLVALIWAIVFAPPLPSLHSRRHFLLWIVIFLPGLASALFIADHVGFAMLEWSWLLALVSLAAMMRQWPVKRRETLDIAILTVALTGSLAYLWWFWRLNAFIYFEPADSEVIRSVSFPGFSNVRYFSDYQSFLLLLLPTALYRLTDPGWTRTLGVWMVGVFFALALITGSRSLIAAHLILHATLWLILRARYTAFLMMQLRFWVYGLLFFVLLTRVLPFILHGGAGQVVSELVRTESSGRTDLWLLAWHLMLEHPLLGIGPMHYAAQINPYAAHPHNLILQFASEWGVPATLALIWLTWDHLTARVRQLRATPVSSGLTMDIAMLAAGSALLIHSMVAGALNYPVTQVAALLFFAYPALTGTPSDSRSTRGIHTIGLVALIVTIATLTSVQSIRERNQCYLHAPWPTSRYMPRFWQQGWLAGNCGEGHSLIPIPKDVMQYIPGRSNQDQLSQDNNN